MPESGRNGTEVARASGPSPQPDSGSLSLSDGQRARFLAKLAEDPTLGTVQALRAVGLHGSRGTLRKLVRDDDELAEQAREARGYGDDQIRGELFRRAMIGVDEPVFHNGEVVGHIRKYSDRLLAMMAKAHLAEYRERLEIAGRDGGPVEVTNPDVAAAIDRFTSNIRRLAERAAEPSGDVRPLELERAAQAPDQPGG